jgi:hypothetical protein
LRHAGLDELEELDLCQAGDATGAFAVVKAALECGGDAADLDGEQVARLPLARATSLTRPSATARAEASIFSGEAFMVFS